VATLQYLERVRRRPLGQFGIQRARLSQHLQRRQPHPSRGHFRAGVEVGNLHHFHQEGVHVRAEVAGEGAPQGEAQRDAFHPHVAQRGGEERRQGHVLFDVLVGEFGVLSLDGAGR